MQTAFYAGVARAVALTAALLLAGCNQRIADVNATLQLAALGYKDVAITKEYVAALPYAAIQFKWGHGPRVLSALAFAEGEELKWVTQDKAMIVTQHGRLVRTQGFSHNLTYTANINNDPLPQLLQLWQQGNPALLRWGTEHDWQPGYFSGYKAISRFEYRGPEQVTILNEPVTLVKFSELVIYPKLNIEQENTFWLATDTGAVIKSRQFIGPGLPAVEITLLKPYQP
ncbi:YjbF family lipoprotein [Oceanisphaera ostreae]|uniref:YjbF family lipoprotein n=1 Tax=Oceanisphaera ostreae TaxID=914151 RepID=A0ABW3KE61_9GAMM